MYDVYKDPGGKRVLGDPTSHHTSTTVKITTTMSNESEENYKRRIESLNVEMKALNNELEKVLIYR